MALGNSFNPASLFLASSTSVIPGSGLASCLKKTMQGLEEKG